MANPAFSEQALEFREMERLVNASHDLNVRRIEVLLRTFTRDVNDFRGPIRGLFEAWRRGQVELSQTPGSDFVDDKELGPYVDLMIYVYLNERPILRAIPSVSLASHVQRGFEWVFHRFPNLSDYVFKHASGLGGSQVIVGEDDDPVIVKKLLRNEYDRGALGDWIAQQYVAPSSLVGNLINLRLMAHAFDEDDVSVTETGYARGRHLSSADSRTNVAQGGHIHVVVVRDQTHACSQFFVRALAP